MEKKEQTVAEPMGICEKLFHALQTNTAFRPLRRLTFGRQDQTDTAAAAVDKVNNPPPPLSFNDSLSSGKNNSLTPTKPHGTDILRTDDQHSSSKQVTTTLVDKLTPPKKANMVKVENKVKKESIEKDTVSPATKVATSVATIITPTKTAKIEPKDSKKLLPTPAPPKGSISPQLTPPPTTTVIMTTTENPMKNINEKVEEYIQSVKDKFRTGSGVGKAPSKNN